MTAFPEDIEQWFTYHTPTSESTERLERVRTSAEALASVILEATPCCADQSAAFRLLRECVMTANAAVVLNQTQP